MRSSSPEAFVASRTFASSASRAACTPSTARWPSATAASRIVSNWPMALRAASSAFSPSCSFSAATRCSALVSASASTLEEPPAASCVMRAIASATSVMRCSAPRSTSAMRPEALRVDSSVTRPRLSPRRKRSAESVAICSCASREPLGQKLGRALRRLLGALAHGVGDAGDALLGRAERVGKERRQPVQAALPPPPPAAQARWRSPRAPRAAPQARPASARWSTRAAC